LSVQVGSLKIAAHRFVLAERCGYFRTAFAESSASAAETAVVKFDFTTVEQRRAFQNLLTFLYTDTCPELTAGCRLVHTDTFSGKTRRKSTTAKDAADENDIHSAVNDPVTSLKLMARQFNVTSLVKR